MPEVNVFKGQFIANVFSLLFAAGRACLLPFLSIYFYYLGLSPTQTGLLLGLKSFTSVWSALCWTKYVGTPKRKRCVLVFSIIVLMLTHLAMMLMPALDTTRASSFCPGLINQSVAVQCNDTFKSFQSGCQNESMPFVGNSTVSTLPNVSISFTGLSTAATNVNVSDASEVDLVTKSVGKSTDSIHSTPIPNAKLQSTSAKEVFSSDTDFEMSRFVSSRSLDKETLQGNEFAKSLNKFVTSPAADGFLTAGEDFVGETSTYESFDRRKSPRRVFRRNLGDDNETQQGITISDEVFVSNSPLASKEDGGYSQDIGSRVSNLMKSLDAIQHQVFVAMLVLVLVGEMFSSPTERLTEDLWLRFLDNFEKLDKSHVPKLWACFGAALTPWAVSLLIDYLPCILPVFQFPRILIHFFSFEIIIALALLLSFCFPVTESEGVKSKKWGRLVRGLRIVCSDVIGFVCMFTVIVVGFIYGFISTFLFWLMHEMSAGGTELPLGIALTLASAGEFFMSFAVGWLVQKLKSPILIMLGLTVLCGRCVLYSFLINPWFAVVGEAGHMLSHTLIWAAVQNYPSFRVNPLIMDMSSHTALSLVYSGFGISSGCMVAGLCYSWVGPQAMFQIAASVAGVWCLIFTIIYKCCGHWRKQRVKYTKISQEEMADSDVSDEDDWLDSAVKHKN